MIRQAQDKDIKAIQSFDPIAADDPTRQEEISEAIQKNHCWVYEMDSKPVAYGVLEFHFFGQAFISVIYVADAHRGSGIGGKIISHIEAQCGRPKIFTSTNQSNKKMQGLLKKAGFERAGEVSGLDEGDPEIFYLKRL